MTTTTARAARPAPTTRRRAERRLGRRFVTSLLVAGAWFWVLWAALVIGAPLAVERWGGELERITYAAAGGPGRWVAFTVGLLATVTLLTIHLAAGGTRRSFVTGVVRGAVPAGLAFGVLTAALAAGERRLYTALERPWTGIGPFAVDSPAGFATTTLGETLVIVTYVLVGSAVAVGYRRSGPWWGTALMVPLLLPAAVVDLATRTGIFGLALRGAPALDPLPTVVVTLAGGIAATALAVLVLDRLLRSTLLRPSN